MKTDARRIINLSLEERDPSKIEIEIQNCFPLADKDYFIACAFGLAHLARRFHDLNMNLVDELISAYSTLEKSSETEFIKNAIEDMINSINSFTKFDLKNVKDEKLILYRNCINKCLFGNTDPDDFKIDFGVSIEFATAVLDDLNVNIDGRMK